MKADADNHVHSKYSECCHENYDLETIIRIQSENGMKYACVTDHIHTDADTGGLSEHFRYLKANPVTVEKIKVYIGAELTFTDHEGNVPLPFLESGEQPDFLTGGCHSIPGYDVSMGDIEKARLKLKCMTDKEFIDFTDVHRRMVKGAVEKGLINILAHPFDLFFRCGIYDSRLLDNFQSIARICRKNDIAVEINNASAGRCISTPENHTEYNKYCIRPADFYLKMINIAVEENVIFSTGSDAHVEISIGRMEYCEEIIKKTGIDHSKLFYLDNGVDNKRYLTRDEP